MLQAFLCLLRQKLINEMIKLLEVLKYSDTDIRINTDIDVRKDPWAVQETVISAIMCMATKLWGGNEISVLAMIRALAIADLALSVNREEMIRFLDQASEDYAICFRETGAITRKEGSLVYPPSFRPSDTKS